MKISAQSVKVLYAHRHLSEYNIIKCVSLQSCGNVAGM